MNTKAFPCLNRHGPIEAILLARPHAQLGHFRVLTDTAPLKPDHKEYLPQNRNDFRVLTDTAPLKHSLGSWHGDAHDHISVS